MHDNKRRRDNYTNEELDLIQKQRLEEIQSKKQFQKVFQQEADKLRHRMYPGTTNENPFKNLVLKEIKKRECPTARERQGIEKHTNILEIQNVPTLLGLDEAEREISRELQNMNELYEREAKRTYYKNRKEDLYRTKGKPIKLKATTEIIERIDRIAEWRCYCVKNHSSLSYYDYLGHIRNKADEEENLLYSLIDQYQDLFDYYYDQQKYGNLKMLKKKMLYEGILRREGQQAVPDIYDSKT